MITGRVTPDGREATIPLTLLGNSAGQSRAIQAIIDTGFTDRLTLPQEIVDDLDLPFRGSVDATLADGSIETLPMYRVRLLWHGQEHVILDYSAPGDPLVGMALLSGSELRVRVVAGGAVQIGKFSGERE